MDLTAQALGPNREFIRPTASYLDLPNLATYELLPPIMVAFRDLGPSFQPLAVFDIHEGVHGLQCCMTYQPGEGLPPQFFAILHILEPGALCRAFWECPMQHTGSGRVALE